jgi:NAD(P)-dependent dehydrogenase (short-subunit alcohol dehydrogenase family)
MNHALAGRVAVITGGASGIGEAAVRKFVAEGAQCVIADMQEELGLALAAELGKAVTFLRVDVAEEDDVASAVETAVRHFGRIDTVFNNAGIVGAIGSVTEMSTKAWKRTIAVDLDSVFFGTKHAALAMIAQGEGGSIINTSSIAGLIGGLGPHAYTAAKHAVIGLTKSTAAELAKHQIRVNAISPGTTVTPLTAGSLTGDVNDMAAMTTHAAGASGLGFAIIADDIADSAVFLASDRSRAITGHTLVVDGGRSTNGGSVRFHSAAPEFLAEAGRRER